MIPMNPEAAEQILRIGVVGIGSMGRNHLRVVDSLPGMTVAAIADTNPQSLSDASVSSTPPAFTDYREMLPLVDAVMVSTPTESHFDVAGFFLKQDRHVLIEKPLARNLEESDELIRLSRERNLVVGVGHLERFNPAVETIQGLIHRPRFIEIQRLGSFSPRSLDVDVILDLMIHDLDIILHWDQSPVREIRAVGIPIISSHIDIANVRLEFQSGLVANVTASRVSQKKTRKLRVFQKNRYISLDYQHRTVKSYSLAGTEIREEMPEVPDQEPLGNLWRRFRDSILWGKDLNVSPEDARKALDLALRISGCIQEGFPHQLSDQ